MKKHFFKTNELPILAAIVLLIKLAALIESPSGRPVTVYTLDTSDYPRAGFDNSSIFILDYDNLTNLTSRLEETPDLILITFDSKEFQYYSSIELAYQPEIEIADKTGPPNQTLKNVNTAGLYIDYGMDCQ